ncbi:MAG: hypothetical protein P8X63_02035 [Desulfuromonadaceae bacterium]
MKRLLLVLLSLILSGCSSVVATENFSTGAAVQTTSEKCPGTVDLSAPFAALFEPVENEALLEAALGKPTEGRLCQGKVYRVKGMEVSLYRAWNSTNPNSRLGKWWAFAAPEGRTTRFRFDFEVCYQWSPLDKLTRCAFRAGTEVVVGTGQSATCDEYLTYPASATQQVYIEDASIFVSGCSDYDAFFKWESVAD